MGECLFKEKALPRALFKTFSENLNCSRRMKSRGAALHKCSRRVGAPVSGRKPKHTQGGPREGAGRFRAVGGVTDKKTERRQKNRETTKNPERRCCLSGSFLCRGDRGAHAAVIFHAVPSDKPRRVFGSGGVEEGPSKKPPPRRIVLINRKCRGSGRCRRG